MTEYQIIGDIHGKFDRLDGLLRKLGWTGGGTTWSPPADTKIIFVGDYIDRGDQQLAVLETVRSLVDAGDAIALMGNHEFNAVCWSMTGPDGNWLREHSESKLEQHCAFLDQLTSSQRSEWISWFTELPLWHIVGDDELRVAHGCWHRDSIDDLERSLGGSKFGSGPDRYDLWVEAANKHTDLGAAIEVILKGPELDLKSYGMPGFYDGKSHSDDGAGPSGTLRHEARIRWWFPNATTLDQIAEVRPSMFNQDGQRYGEMPAIPLSEHDLTFSYSDAVPMVYGHHWREWEPSPDLDFTATTACVDFSAGKGGPLVAYRWNGERTIDRSHYIQFGHS